MRVFATTARDNERGVMRVELSGEDAELLEAVAERLDVLAQVEDALEVKAVYAPTFLGSDIPTVTREGAAFIRKLAEGWDAPRNITNEIEEPWSAT